MNREAPCSTVGSLPDHLDLVNDQAEVRRILGHLAYDDKDVFGSLFVDVESGDYSEVWACRKRVPFLHHTVYKLR